jgi:hypothetical protein
VRRTRAYVIPEALPMEGIRSFRGPRKGWRRDEPGENGGGGGGGSDNDGDDDGKADDDASKKPKMKGEFDPDRAAASLAAAREAEKKAIERAKASDARMKGVLAALGLGADGKADPEAQAKELTADRDTWKTKATTLAIKNAIRSGADQHKANSAELLDSQSFLKGVAALDPAADDFDDKVAELVKNAVKTNPGKYGTATGQGSGNRGHDHSGGGGQKRPAGLGAAIAARMSK